MKWRFVEAGEYEGLDGEMRYSITGERGSYWEVYGWRRGYNNSVFLHRDYFLLRAKQWAEKHGADAFKAKGQKRLESVTPAA